jgi:hypothetical protein
LDDQPSILVRAILNFNGGGARAAFDRQAMSKSY